MGDSTPNRQNNNALQADPSEVSLTMQSKKPACARDLCIVASDGKVMLPHIMNVGLYLAAKEYVQVLQRMILSRAKRNYEIIRVISIQDRVPAYKAKTAQSWWQKNLPLSISLKMWAQMRIVRIFPVHVHSACFPFSPFCESCRSRPLSLGGLKASQPKPGGPASSQQQHPEQDCFPCMKL